MICTSLAHEIMLAAYQLHHIAVSHHLASTLHVLAQKNNNTKTSVLLSSQPTNTHRLSGSCLFLSQACHDSATLPSDCVRSWHTEQSKQGNTVYFHSSLVQVPAVCCLRVIFPPCARVFMQWRNFGRTVILLSHRNKRERQRNVFFCLDQRKLVIVKAKTATPLLCVYIPPLRQSRRAALSPIETCWQMVTHNVERMLHCVLFNWQDPLLIADQPLSCISIFSLHLEYMLLNTS